MVQFAFVDVETFYSQEYSLKNMTPAEYVLDHRFECIGWSVAEDNGPARWLDPNQFRVWLACLPRGVAFVSHNALFDMFVLAWRFGYIPDLMFDTLGMARAMIYAETGSAALKACAKYLGLPDKGDTIHKVIGMTRDIMIQSGIYPEFVKYAVNDVELCRGVFKELLKRGFPRSELFIMSEVVRACVSPQLQLNTNLLHTHLHFTKVAKEGVLERAGLTDRSILMSNERFAAALIQLGVEPPTKISPTTGRETYAFAKTDLAFTDLLEHEDIQVQAMVAARLGVKTTIEETRTGRLISLANLTYPANPGSWLPVPLRYSGAHTHRLSGDWKINLQNLSKKGLLRKSIKASKGKVVVAGDASQIEARFVAKFCRANNLVAQFANKEDVYSTFATSVYGYSVTKANKPERFIGKTSILGLGFGMGPPRFDLTVRTQSKIQNIEVEMNEQLAARVVNLYRTKYPTIPNMWDQLKGMIPQLARGANATLYADCPVTFVGNTVVLPNGLKLYYHDLQFNAGQWTFQHGRMRKRLFGGKLLENIIQALARIVVMDAMMRINKITGKHFALQVHDELAYVVDEKDADDMLALLIEEISRCPDWMPGLPLAAEGGFNVVYGDIEK